MAVSHKARISAAERAEIKSLQKSYRSKLSRLIKKGIDSSLLPTKDISILFGDETRKELNAAKKIMKDFTNRGNLKYQFKKITNAIGKDNYITKETWYNIKEAQKEANKAAHMKSKMSPKKIKKLEDALQGLYPDTEKQIGRHKENPRQKVKYDRTYFENEKQAKDYQKRTEKATEYYNKQDEVLKENMILSAYNRYSEKWAAKVARLFKKTPAETLAWVNKYGRYATMDYMYSYAKMGHEESEAYDNIRSEIDVISRVIDEI